MKKIGIICRYTQELKNNIIQNPRFYIAKEFVDIAETLNVLFMPIYSSAHIENYLDECDGLLVPGSYIDIDPKYYGETPLEETAYESFDLYNLDRSIIKPFYDAGKKIMGICAGLQALNVVFGGSITQNISNHNLELDQRHTVKLITNTWLHNHYQKDVIKINSLHHQAINQLANDFTISAISEDGIIEAIEAKNIIAVQWHPELLNDLDLFKDFFEI